MNHLMPQQDCLLVSFMATVRIWCLKTFGIKAATPSSSWGRISVAATLGKIKIAFFLFKSARQSSECFHVIKLLIFFGKSGAKTSHDSISNETSVL